MSSPAETYESYMVPAFFDPLATHVLAVAQPQPGERVLDAACGTGIVARRVAALVGTQGQVVGLDLNPAMLTVARDVATREGLTVDWREGRVESLPFPDAAFDLVVCQHGLQYVPDRAAAVAELQRVLCPGGRVVVSVQQPIKTRPFDLRLDAVLQARLGFAPSARSMPSAMPTSCARFWSVPACTTSRSPRSRSQRAIPTLNGTCACG